MGPNPVFNPLPQSRVSRTHVPNCPIDGGGNATPPAAGRGQGELLNPKGARNAGPSGYGLPN